MDHIFGEQVKKINLLAGGLGHEEQNDLLKNRSSAFDESLGLGRITNSGLEILCHVPLTFGIADNDYLLGKWAMASQRKHFVVKLKGHRIRDKKATSDFRL